MYNNKLKRLNQDFHIANISKFSIYHVKQAYRRSKQSNFTVLCLTFLVSAESFQLSLPYSLNNPQGGLRMSF